MKSTSKSQFNFTHRVIHLFNTNIINIELMSSLWSTVQICWTTPLDMRWLYLAVMNLMSSLWSTVQIWWTTPVKLRWLSYSDDKFPTLPYTTAFQLTMLFFRFTALNLLPHVVVIYHGPASGSNPLFVRASVSCSYTAIWFSGLKFSTCCTSLVGFAVL